ncbi:hypothetical protein PGT21_001250 [Puccinia graminis f. sp. tritici]|uniref:Uncharacterized protein n=1 Tax=Puccinia graminis f. sp. tritici TaxID=56615 RepID=A0A5B0MVJ3_PUCGR|nr:hypothetical protein PGTUg99_005191 [Puccinia graminis f. sp. tritici]KAA1103810.1 hypothetical protein PGT21_001250 [Puccinia graminis f. sp. tritici]
MSFNGEWIPGATFSGRAFPDDAVDTPLSNATAPRSNDGDSLASGDSSIASDDEEKIANDGKGNSDNNEAVILTGPNAIAFATV